MGWLAGKGAEARCRGRKPLTAVDQTLLRRCSSTCAQHTSARWGLAVFQVRRILEQPIITSAQSMGGSGVALHRVRDMTGSRHRAVFLFMADVVT